MIARGNVRKLIIALGEIQDRVGAARNLYADDRSIGAFEKADDALKEAFDLCVKARSMYDPVDNERCPNCPFCSTIMVYSSQMLDGKYGIIGKVYNCPGCKRTLTIPD